MHIRILKYKFTNDVKANLFLSFIKSEMYDLYKKKSKCISVEFIKTGEGQLISIARYNSKEEFEDTNKWAAPVFHKNVRELDGILESMPGELVSYYNKNS